MRRYRTKDFLSPTVPLIARAAVLAGEKIFTLLPPVDRPALRYETCRTAQYKQHLDRSWTIERLAHEYDRPWIVSDTWAPSRFLRDRFPDMGDDLVPLQVSVKCGGALWLLN